MPTYFTMHTDNPQPRLIKQVVKGLQAGDIMVYPTDLSYALGCVLSNRHGQESIRRLRGLSDSHPLTLLCCSIAQVSQYCFLENEAFKILKQFTPGPYTFILPANKNVPRPAQGVKRKVVGVRIPNHPIPLALINALNEPLITTTLWLKGEETPLSCVEQIIQKTQGKVNLILDGGKSNPFPTSVIDLTGKEPVILRKGLGDTDWFETTD